MQKTQLFINGVWIEPKEGSYADVISPWDQSTVGQVALASQEQAQNAVTSAKKAFTSWRKTDLSYRIYILKKFIKKAESNALNIAKVLSKEIGKNEKDALSEVKRSIEYIELTIEAAKMSRGFVYYGDMFDKYSRGKKTGIYSREPLGIVLAISPFNYPINLSIIKIAPALITGNTVVFKPSTQGAISTELFYKHLVDSGIDSGVFNLVSGNSSQIGDLLVSHDDIDLIAFTGSTKTGKHIGKISKGIPLLMELGGKDLAIVTENADLEIASDEIVKGGFSYCGQRCTAQKAVIAYQSIADKLTQLIIEKTKKIELNPMIDNKSADYVEELINEAKNKGADIVLKGERNNNYLKASIADKVTSDMRLFKEEQFGPVLPILRVRNENEAIAVAQKSTYGLQASVYSNHIEEAFRIADKLEVGTVQINGKGDRGPDNFPFGGVNDSGQYMQGAMESLDLMTRGKLTVVNRHES